MISVLPYFIFVPIIGYLFCLLLPPKKEDLISWSSFFFVGIHQMGAIAFIIYWLIEGQPVLSLPKLVLYQTTDYEFFLSVIFDRITAVYLFVGSFLTMLVTIYSRYYMHREGGYKRFFNTILFFYIGYNIIIFSGNLETLFIGWEILGISSFLLIAFYRDRYLPVKNAVKVFSIYRIGDVGLILAMWATHHLFHQNITFLELSNYELVHDHLATHSIIGAIISILIFISASAKSALLPFSSWLPRAMEGPTPSSAIFYGSLSVHLGVFLMLRTYPFWEHQFSVRILFVIAGLTSAIVATLIARVQSSVKSQIAYASIGQIGLIFIEMSLGFEGLALFHFAGNAFLRTYQLLVSPSVVSYLIREQFYNFSPRATSIESSLPKKIQYSLYILCVKEWNLDSFMYRRLWNPLKWLGNRLNFLTLGRVLYIFVPAYLIGLYCIYHRNVIPPIFADYMPGIFALIGLTIVLKAFTERKQARMSWLLIVMSHFWIALSVAFNENFTFDQVHYYLSGVAIAGVLGLLAIWRLRFLEGNIDLDQFHGHSYKHPKIAFFFFLCCLAASGFPITPTFIGEDLIFTHIHEDQPFLAFTIALCFIIDGLAIIRIYARIFLGPHVKSIYEMAYRSS